MKTNWKDMSVKEKILTVAYIVVGLAAIAFAVADVADLWEHAHASWMFSFSILFGIESVRRWKESRKIAIFELVCGVLMLALAIGNIFV